MYCKVCGKELPNKSTHCSECGTPVDGSGYQEMDQASQGGSFDTGSDYYQDNRSQYGGYYQQEPVYERQSGARKGFAIASMVLGIIGLVGVCCSMMTYGAMSLILGVLGLIFGILGLKSQGKGMAIAGIVMACLNIVIGILLLALMLIGLRTIGSMSPEEYESFFQEIELTYGLNLFRLRRLFF